MNPELIRIIFPLFKFVCGELSVDYQTRQTTVTRPSPCLPRRSLLVRAANDPLLREFDLLASKKNLRKLAKVVQVDQFSNMVNVFDVAHQQGGLTMKFDNELFYNSLKICKGSLCRNQLNVEMGTLRLVRKLLHWVHWALGKQRNDMTVLPSEDLLCFGLVSHTQLFRDKQTLTYHTCLEAPRFRQVQMDLLVYELQDMPKLFFAKREPNAPDSQ